MEVPIGLPSNPSLKKISYLPNGGGFADVSNGIQSLMRWIAGSLLTGCLLPVSWGWPDHILRGSVHLLLGGAPDIEGIDGHLV